MAMTMRDEVDILGDPDEVGRHTQQRAIEVENGEGLGGVGPRSGRSLRDEGGGSGRAES